MPAPYGSLAAVQQLLQATTSDTFDVDQEARITALLDVASALVEDETGRVFGVTPATPETLLVSTYQPNRMLFLPKGLRSLTSIEQAGTWTGTTWTGGTTVATTDYRLAGQVPTSGVYRAILAVNGLWSGGYTVTGVWEDQQVDVPDDITYVVNYIAAETWKKESASPAGFQGPDGATVPIRKVMADEIVQRILSRNRRYEPLLVV